MMGDEDSGCIKKLKLIITVKTLSTYNDRTRVAAKQTNKHTYSETQKLTNILKDEKYILTRRRTNRLIADTRTQRVKQKMKNGAPYVLLSLK